MQRLALALMIPLTFALAADKYDGPRPPRPDMLASGACRRNLVPTEALDAKEESGGLRRTRGILARPHASG